MDKSTYVKDYVCCKSTLLKNLEKKYGKSIKLLSVLSNGGELKKYVFSIGGKDEDGDSDNLFITTTEDGLMFKLLELSSGGGICKYCESRDTDDCLKTRLESGCVRKEEFVHKVDEELCFA